MLYSAFIFQIAKYMAKKVPGLHVHALMIGDNFIQVMLDT